MVTIQSLACYVPEKTVSNDDLSEFLDTSHEWIYTRTGIENRHIAVEDSTSTMCHKVSLQLLEKTQTKAEDIELIIAASVTPDFAVPSTACLVQNLLGNKKAVAFDINAACSGFVYALSVGEKLIRSGAYSNALILAGETLSKITNWDERSTAVLFGDGAGGALLTAGDKESFLGEDIHSDGEKWSKLTVNSMPTSNCYVENPWSKYIQMDGRTVFEFAVKSVPQSILNLLSKTNYTLDDIDYIIPHQANSRIVDGIIKKLKVSPDKMFVNIGDYGNTSSASIPIALCEMEQKGMLKPGSGQKIIISGFGGGLTWGSLLLSL